MGVLQSSINQAMTTAMAGALGVEHIKTKELSELTSLPSEVAAAATEHKELSKDLEQLAGEKQSIEESATIAELEGREDPYAGPEGQMEKNIELEKLDKAMKRVELLQGAKLTQATLKEQRFEKLYKKYNKGGKK